MFSELCEGHTESNRYTSVVIQEDFIEDPHLASGEAMLRQLGMIWMSWGTEARENDRNPSTNRLGSIKPSLGGDEK